MAKQQQVRIIDPVFTFQVATAYHRSVQRLTSSIADEATGTIDPLTMIPSMMLSAFSSELYMKASYAADNNGNAISGHFLDTLFGDLTEDFQSEVRRQWPHMIASIAARFPRENTDLDFNLQRSRSAFENMRYFHEGKSEAFLLWPLPAILQFVLIATNPIFRNVAPLCGQPTLAGPPIP